MSNYQKNGNIWKPYRDGALNLHDRLDPGNYKIALDQYGEFYLEKIDDFDVPAEVYGDLPDLARRVMTTFRSRPMSTGVLLSGEKGSGKTLLAKKVCVDLNIPAIVVNSPLVGDKFNSFLQAVSEPCAVFFDEFEKVYSSQEQEKLLTLLDGVYPSKKLFLLTSNNSYRVDEHMRNRPGRIYYYLQFSGLEESFVREFCEAKLDNKENVEKVVALARLFSQFNFDMLKSVVEELNRFPELDARDAVKLLNVKPESDAGGIYSQRLYVNGIEAEIARGDRTRRGHPLSVGSWSYDYVVKTEEGKDDDDWTEVLISTDDFAGYDAVTGVYTFKKQGGIVLTQTLVPASQRVSFMPW